MCTHVIPSAISVCSEHVHIHSSTGKDLYGVLKCRETPLRAKTGVLFEKWGDF